MSDTEKPQEENQEQYEIGQIVYILSDKAEAIVPAIVVEELVHKKLDGNSISWKVAVGPPEKKKIVASDEISGDIYISLEDIQEVMVKRLTSFVDGLVGTARERTEKWYGKITKPASNTKAPGGKIDPADLLDTIDGRENAQAFRQLPGQTLSANNQKSNGSVSGMHENLRIKAPINNGPLQPSRIDPSDPRAALRANLRKMASVPEEEFEAGSMNENDEFIVTDDGRRIPVKYNLEQD